MKKVTEILGRIELGDAQAADQLLPLVYAALRRLAAQKIAQEQPGQTLQQPRWFMRRTFDCSIASKYVIGRAAAISMPPQAKRCGAFSSSKPAANAATKEAGRGSGANSSNRPSQHSARGMICWRWTRRSTTCSSNSQAGRAGQAAILCRASPVERSGPGTQDPFPLGRSSSGPTPAPRFSFRELYGDERRRDENRARPSSTTALEYDDLQPSTSAYR